MLRLVQNTQAVFWAAMLFICPALAFAGEGEKVPEETAAQVRQTIESYVKKDSALKDGFLLVDPQKKESVNLTFDHVHQGVEKVGGEYVACADFRRGEKVYDVDFFLQPQEGEWEVTRLRVHKIDGKKIEP